MGYKKMYGDTIEFDQENKYINIPSTSALKFAGTTVGSLASLGSTALTSTAAEVNTLHSSGITNADLVKMHAIASSAAQIDAAVGASGAIVSITGAGALTAAANAGRVNVINSAAGIAITLPAATGSGMKLALFIGTTITSSTTTITTASGSDFIAGAVLQAKTDGTTKTYNANGTSHRIVTMDGSTKGGIIGDRINLVDIKANLWSLEVIQQATGTVANPIS